MDLKLPRNIQYTMRVSGTEIYVNNYVMIDD